MEKITDEQFAQFIRQVVDKHGLQPCSSVSSVPCLALAQWRQGMCLPVFNDGKMGSRQDYVRRLSVLI